MSKPDTWELKASSTDSPARLRSRDPSLMPTEFTTIVDRRVSKPGPSVDLSIFNSPAPSTGASSSRPAADRPPSGHHSRDSSRASSSSHAPAGGVHVLPSASGPAPSSASRTSRAPSSGSPSPHPVPDSFRADATWTPSITASVPRESASRSRPAETMPSLPPYAKSAAMSRTSSAHGSASSSASAPDTDSKSSDKVDVREAVEKRRSEIAAVLKVIRLSEKVDLCFMLDCTGSMGPWIDAVKRTIDEVVDRVKGSFPNLAFRLAFVRYTDFDMGAQRTSMLDFTSIVDDFKRFLGTIKADGGGDAPEDVMGGLEAAIRLKWNQGGTHILIHIADCPAHGRQYHSRDMGDNYPEGRGMSHQEAMKALADLNVMYNFGYINRGNTDKMVQVFDEELKRITNDRLGVSQFDATRPDQLQFELIGTVTQSITQSLTTASRAAVGVGKEERSVARNFVKSDQAPNWDNPADYAEMPVVVIRYGLPSTIEETCDPEFSLAEKRVTETIKICKWAFAVGGVRVAFRAQNAKHKVELVVKMGKTLGRGANSKKGYLLDMETQSIAQKFLVEFNEEMKKAGVVQLPVKFVLAKVMQVKASETPFYAAMEPFIEQGNPFLKFNSNAGFRLEDPAYEFLQAFSHWSWKRSRGYTLVCDLQGFVLPDKIMLTDPAIHSKNLLRGSKTNLGVPGMELFFKTHVCGPTCAALGLKQDDFASRKTA